MLSIVTLGASAGGLEALREFFRAARPQPDLAVVVVTHLPASHDSHLVELLANVGTLPVRAALEKLPVEGGVAYVLPPGVSFGIQDGRFASLPVATARPPVPARPIDAFMAALAEDAPDRCIGVVLSGTDHDGTAGLKAIRAAGGLALVQDPATAEFPGMPRSAIDAGVADQVLAPSAMPGAISEYLGHAPADLEPADTGDAAAGDDDRLQDVLKAIHTGTGHDFQWYRPGMLRRRLRRRMSLNRVDRVADYLAFLERSAEETEALKNEFLIGVTDFFRDPEVWRELESTVVPALLRTHEHGDEPVRVWTPGCATGEESYSIAMLLLERLSGRDAARVQVFGTDIDLDALAVARAGSYAAGCMANVAPERLARFFQRQGERYVVRKSLRDAIVFAPHDLVRDTPYSKIDLVVCRNVLIYFRPELQARVFELFHFALRPDAWLLLGKAETVGPQTALFEPVSPPFRLHRRVGGRARLPSGFGRSTAGTGLPLASTAFGAAASPEDILLRALGDRVDGAAVLVDVDGLALCFRGDVHRYLRHRGTASLALLTLVVPRLGLRLRLALREALHDQHATVQLVTADVDGVSRRIRMEVEPVLTENRRRMALVRFDVVAEQDARSGVLAGPLDDPASSDREIDETRRELAIALEEAERSNQDLRVANEESLSLNEELQSSNEELESSKEELQSMNEELATVNAQLEEKVRELANTNQDLNHLLASSRVATVLLDADRRVRRFTPSAREIFNLQPGDEGRLLSDISSRVVDPTFARDLAHLADAVEPLDAEIATDAGSTYLRTLLPYRATDGQVTGIVATYADVTALRTASRRVRELVAVLDDSNDAVIVYDFEGRILEWNEGARRAYGYSRDEVLGTSVFDLAPEAAREDLRRETDAARASGHAGPTDAPRRLRAGGTRTVSVTLSALRDSKNQPYALLSTERDITERLAAEKEMYFRRLADLIPALLRVEDSDGRTEFVNEACANFTGRARGALLGDGWLDAMSPEDRPGYLAALARALTERAGYHADYRYRRADGRFRWMRCIGVPRIEDGTFAGYVALSVDVEDRKRAEDALLQADRRKDEYLATLAHELRNPLAPIRNAVAVLQGHGDRSREAAWATGVIARQTEALAKLLDDLLDVARIARGKVVLDRRPVDLVVIVDRAVEMASPAIEARGQHLDVRVAAEPLTVEGDLLRLTQALTNLLNNASKYSDVGGRIAIDLTRAGGWARIAVSDDGAGIAADMLPRVFDLFAQADRTLDRAKGGLGLGLTLVRRLVELHGGAVEATSEGLGRGSRFVITLPVLAAALPERSRPPEARARRSEDCRRVLIVDDNADGAESLAIFMRKCGHDVRTAPDGARALQTAEDFVPDVVILDIGLPDLDGYEIARTLRSRRASARATLIALTGYGQPDDVDRAAAAGFDHHVVKPADPDRLLELVAGAPRP